jgi:hypothetical protein
MKYSKESIALLSVILFTFLFYQKELGINVFLFAAFTVLANLFLEKKVVLKPMHMLILGGMVLTSGAYFLWGSPFTLVILLVSYVLLLGVQTEVRMRNLTLVLPNGFVNAFKGIGRFFNQLILSGPKKGRNKMGNVVKVVAIPLLVVILFTILYANGSSYFADVLGSVGEWVNKALANWVDVVSFKLVLVICFGIIFSTVYLLQRVENRWQRKDKQGTDQLKRKRIQSSRVFRTMDLKYEYRSGIFLFATLNVLLLSTLFLEVKNIWFGFEYEGQLLKGMVHEGTYVLILSIVLSMVVVMYFFRNNLNFLPKNKLLKTLAYVWILLNAIMVIAVFVRNGLYIRHFALAYKRIGVILFLLLCLVGLTTMVLKISHQRSTYFVTRVNALAVYLGLVLVSLFNWDVIIAKYNFSKADSAFIHLPFMARLSNKALPYLQLTEDEINTIEKKQEDAVPFYNKGYFFRTDFREKIKRRTATFLTEQEKKHWLEQIYAEKKAYKLLKNQASDSSRFEPK